MGKMKETLKDNSIFTTTFRVSETLMERIKAHADKTGASTNSVMCMLIDLGLKVVENDITVHQKER